MQPKKKTPTLPLSGTWASELKIEEKLSSDAPLARAAGLTTTVALDVTATVLAEIRHNLIRLRS
jgi:hypothetical protein